MSACRWTSRYNGIVIPFMHRKIISTLHTFALILVVQGFCANAADSPPMKSNEHNLNVTNGANFTIDLRCSAGQGFSWRLAEISDTNAVTLLRQRFTNEIDKDGSDGIQHFDFKALATGRANLRFIYVQPFRQPFPKDAKSTNVIITIKQPKD